MLLELVMQAAEALWSLRLRSVLAITGIVIGIAAVIAAYSVTESARHSILSELVSSADTLFQLNPGEPLRGASTARSFPDHYDITYVSRLVSGIKNVILFQGIRLPWRYGELSGAWYVTGVTPGLQSTGLIRVVSGRFISETDQQLAAEVVVLGKDLASELFPGQEVIGRRITIDDRTFIVIGTVQQGSDFSNRLQPGSNDHVYVPIGVTKRLLGSHNYHNVLFQVSSSELREPVRRRVEDLMQKRHFGYRFRTVVLDGDIKRWTEISRIMTGVVISITSISLFIGSIGITNVMLMAVRERTKEVGIAKAIGATNGMVLLQFLVEAIILCCIGGVLGLLLGYALGGVTSRLWLGIDFEADLSVGLGALATAFVVGLVSGAYPALVAARVDPVVALRAE